MEFKIILEKDEDGWFVATCPSLPGCISQGRTEQEAKKNMKEAIRLHIRSLASDGIPLIKSKKVKEVALEVTI